MSEPLESRTLFATVSLPGNFSDSVYDDDRGVLYYSAAGSGTVSRYDVADHAPLAPLATGLGVIWGIDLSPDGSALYSAQGGRFGTGTGTIKTINIADGTAQDITYPLAPSEFGPRDIAIGASGKALFVSEMFQSNAPAVVHDLDLSTGAVTLRPDAPPGRPVQYTVMERSRDRRSIGVADLWDAPGKWSLYDSASDTFGPGREAGTALAGRGLAFSDDASRMALLAGPPTAGGPGTISVIAPTSVSDKSAGPGGAPVRNLGRFDGGAFSPAGTVFYTADTVSNEIVAFDTSSWREMYRLPAGVDIPAPYPWRAGAMSVSGDGSTLFLTTTNALNLIDLPGEGATAAAQLHLGGLPTFARADTPFTFTVRADSAAGSADAAYRGTVHFSTGDVSDVLPPDYTFAPDDQGVHVFTVRFGTAGPRTLAVTDVAAAAPRAGTATLTVHGPDVSLIPSTALSDMVFDAARNQLLVTTTRGLVQRYDLATQSLLEPVSLAGALLGGADLSPDGSTLYVAESQWGPAGGFVHAVPLGAGGGKVPTRTFVYDRAAGEAPAYDLTVLPDGKVLLLGGPNIRTATNAFAPLRQLDPASGAVSARADAPGGGGPGLVRFANLAASADRATVLLGERPVGTGATTSPLFTYDAASDAFTPPVADANGTAGVLAVSPDGSLFAAVQGTGLVVRSRGAPGGVGNVIATLPGMTGGVAFDPSGANLYAVDPAADVLVAYDTRTWTQKLRVPVGENVSTAGGLGRGKMVFNGDGSLLFLATGSGLRVIRTGGPPTVAAGGPYFGLEGGDAVRLSASAGVAYGPSNSIVRYEWDFDYAGDPAEFSADAEGANASVPGSTLDGPAVRNVAVRATDSRGQSTIATGTLNVRNAPPTLRAAGAASAVGGRDYTLALSSADVASDSVRSWEFDWGDGTRSTVAGGETSATHRYAGGTATRAVRAWASDEDGTYAVDVSMAPPDAGAPVGPDTAFAGGNYLPLPPGGPEYGPGSALLLQPDGKLIVFGQGSAQPAWPLVRLNPDGTPDQSFGTSGFASVPGPAWMESLFTPDAALQADGKIILAGMGSKVDPTVGRTSFSVLTRLNANGSLDASFGDGGFLFGGDRFGDARAVVIRPDGRILLIASYHDPAPGTDWQAALVQYLPDWTLDRSFGDGGIAPLGAPLVSVNRIVLQPDGKALLAGQSHADHRSIVMARVTDAGAPDPTFGPDASGIAYFLGSANFADFVLANKLALQPDGRFVIAGEVLLSSSTQWLVARFRADGSLDTGFGNGGRGFLSQAGKGEAKDVVIEPGGSVLVAGHEDGVGAEFVRYRADGSFDPSLDGDGKWAPPLFNGNEVRLYDVVLRPDGRAVAAGWFENMLVGGYRLGSRVSQVRVEPAPSVVVARQIFYRQTPYDGVGPLAIATDKQAFLPGQPGTFANVSGYSKGINGVIIDFDGLPADATPTAEDFDIAVNPGGPSSEWAAGPRPAEVSVRRGGGAGGSDRVVLVWADGAIRDTWLRVGVRATRNTALAAPDVFQYGSLVGETGDAATPLRVSAIDLVNLRRHLATAGTADVLGTDPFDLNHDGRVNALDFALVRASLFHALQPIRTAATAATLRVEPLRDESSASIL